jgi:hypothetical protein
VTSRSFARRGLAAALFAAATLLVAHVYAAAMSDQQLFESGKQAHEQGNAIDALMYLFAYQQRSPAVLQQSPEHVTQVEQVITFSRGRLQFAIERSNALEQEVRQLRQQLGMPGVSGEPLIRIPRLDPPRPSGDPTYPLACRGGGGMQFSLTSAGFGMSGTMVVIAFRRAAGFGVAALAPGECAWLDRPVQPQEPDHICDPVETSRLHVQWSADGTVQNLSSISAPYLAGLTSPAQVSTFRVANNRAGCLVVRDAPAIRGRGRGR